MTAIFYFFLFCLFAGGVIWLFLSVPAGRLAYGLSRAVPFALMLIGGLLTLIGKGAFGIPMVALGLGWWQRLRNTTRLKTGSGGKTSTVRTAALEMFLDHDSGEMNGTVLTGKQDGRKLADLDQPELISLYEEIGSDSESAALLETYLDRRFADWREHTQAHTGERQAGTPGSGAMTKQEAYQILGLEPGASPAEINKAWRNLMKSMHPDSGGSAFLAAKINAAKDILLN